MGVDSLAAVHFLEFDGHLRGVANSRRVFRYVVGRDSPSRQVFEAVNLVHNDAFQYRVFADSSSKAPLDGPSGDWSPHPTGQPDSSTMAFVSPNLISMEGFNQFSDPWLASGATVTTGNNVEAYADVTSGDGFNSGDVRADVTAPGVFDRTYDPVQNSDANSDQIKAEVTNMFYIINWLHDYWYDSGFTEAAGNAQDDNYGRGGTGGDSIKAEAQDYSGTNSSDMSTPADGMRPRMQMYRFGGGTTFKNLFANEEYVFTTASFGPQIYSVRSIHFVILFYFFCFCCV